MTTFAEVQNAIREGFVTLSGLHDKAVAWSDNAQAVGKTRVILDVVYFQDMDQRDCYEQNALDPTQFDWTLSTFYFLRIQVRVESIYNQPGHDAMVVAHRIKAGLRRPGFDWGLGQDLKNQQDTTTYFHHLSFEQDDTTINAHAFETNFRAVVDFPTDEEEVTVPGMQEVHIEEAEAEIGEDTPVEINQTIARP